MRYIRQGGDALLVSDETRKDILTRNEGYLIYKTTPCTYGFHDCKAGVWMLYLKSINGGCLSSVPAHFYETVDLTGFG